VIAKSNKVRAGLPYRPVGIALIPNPLSAEFSPFTIVTSTFQRESSGGRNDDSAPTPAIPTTSPMNRIRIFRIPFKPQPRQLNRYILPLKDVCLVYERCNPRLSSCDQRRRRSNPPKTSTRIA
jgi:hypothetical protein